MLNVRFVLWQNVSQQENENENDKPIFWIKKNKKFFDVEF